MALPQGGTSIPGGLEEAQVGQLGQGMKEQVLVVEQVKCQVELPQGQLKQAQYMVGKNQLG